jgi:NAD(P)-dependent dehydrogenase (short-subunit alcohol dehydrogenase family)
MSFTRYESLKGRTVVVTGGASGIGVAFVRAFTENGAQVAFLDVQAEAGTALADALQQMFVPCDLTDIAALHAALDQVRAALGPAAILVNNAANDQRYEFAAITPDEFDRTIARAVGPDRIRVNAIAPGTVLTERQRRLWFQDESQIEAARAQQCLPDLLAPEDIANLALFLAADDSRLITKQCISVNAGTV